MRNKPAKRPGSLDIHYNAILGDVFNGFEVARNSVARSVNRTMTSSYWLLGRRIVEFEQKGERRAEYGEELIERLAADLSPRYGRGFSVRNVWQMKAFYLTWPIPQTPSAESCQPHGRWHGHSGELTPSPAGFVPAKAEMNEGYFRR